MRRCTRSIVIAVLTGVCTQAAAQQPPGFADPILGRWDLTITDASQNTWPSWLEVRLRTEGELMGRFVGQVGSVRHLHEISWNNGVLTFRAPPQYEQRADHLLFVGQRDGDQLIGETWDANGNRQTWIARRAPSLLPEDTPRQGAAIALFNGQDLTGWSRRADANAQCWSVDDGILTATPPCADLITEQHFGNFELNVEFSYPAGSNSGIYLRGRYEIQVQDTAGQALDPLRMGAVYGFIAPVSDAAGKPGEWQSMNIRLDGREVSVVLNGRTIIDAERIPGITGGALDSNEGEPGPIMLQGDHGMIHFRRIELTPLVSDN